MKKLILSLCFIVLTLLSVAQNLLGKKVVVVSYTNIEYIGVLKEQNARELLIVKEDGIELYIPAYVVKRVEAISDENSKNGQYLSGNPHSSRYFYTPSAFPIKKGDGYIQSIYAGVWQFQYGITDRFSIGIGTPIIGAPIWITPKYSFKLSDNVFGAIGAQAGSLGWISGNWNAPFGIGYGVLSFGDEQQNISVGAGYYGGTYFDEEFVVTDPITYDGYYKDVRKSIDGFALSLAGMKRIQKNMLVLGEFWYAPNVNNTGTLFFGGPGLRLMREQNVWDFGFWIFRVNDNGNVNAIPIPYISFTWKLL